MQRYSFSTQKPDRDSTGDYVRISDVRAIIRSIVKDASPCATACHSVVADSVLDAACEAVGINRESANAGR